MSCVFFSHFGKSLHDNISKHVILAFSNGMLKVEVMGVSLKTEKRRGHCPVFSFRQRARRAEGLPGMTTEGLHGHERQSAPPACFPLSAWSSPITLRFLF